MKKWKIENRISGVVLGVDAGKNEESALNAMAQDAGYRDYSDACEVTGVDANNQDLSIHEIGEVDFFLESLL